MVCHSLIRPSAPSFMPDLNRNLSAGAPPSAYVRRPDLTLDPEGCRAAAQLALIRYGAFSDSL